MSEQIEEVDFPIGEPPDEEDESDDSSEMREMIERKRSHISMMDKHREKKDIVSAYTKGNMVETTYRCSIGHRFSHKNPSFSSPLMIFNVLFTVIHTMLDSINPAHLCGLKISDYLHFSKFNVEGDANRLGLRIQRYTRVARLRMPTYDKSRRICILIGKNARGSCCENCKELYNNLYCMDAKHGTVEIRCPAGFMNRYLIKSEKEMTVDGKRFKPMKFDPEILKVGMRGWENWVYHTERDDVRMEDTYVVHYLGNELSGLPELLVALIHDCKFFD